MAKLPQQFIDDLVSRVDIVEVINARVPLRKAGRDYSACCPFHDEKSPSFTVSPAKQFYHCFGCGAHGTVIGFLMEYERLSFMEAVTELAARAGVPLPDREAAAGPAPGADLYDLLAQCAAFYRRELTHPDRGRTAMEYLRRRGLSDTVMERFGVGLAPAGWDGLARAVGGGDKGRQERLITAGMLVRKAGSGVYDRFRGRVMFPIRDQRGRVIAFGGRVLDGGTPKYLNSPETPVYHKGRELYGLFEAREAAPQHARILVVEGYMDVLALADEGVTGAVATLGTATSLEHLERLYRWVPEIVFCFDGDRAGRTAAWRALEHALPVLRDGRQARFMFLPDGEDPDTLVRKEGRQAFEERVAHSVPVSTYFFETLCAQVDITSMDGRARAAELARPLLSKLPAGVFKHMMLARLADIAHIDAEALSHYLADAKAPIPTVTRRRPSPAPRAPLARTTVTPVQQAIRLLLQRPQLARAVADTAGLEGLEIPGTKLLKQLLDLIHANPHLSCSALIEHWRDRDEGRHLMKLAQWQHPLAEADLEAEFLGAIEGIFRQQTERRIAALLRKPEKTAEEKAELNQLLARQRPTQ